MTELQYSTGSFRVSRARAAHSPQQRLFGIAFAVAMEVGIVAALVFTLRYVDAPDLRRDITVVNVPPVPDEPIIPIPPPQIFTAPPLQTPIPPEVVLTYTPPAPTTAISTPPPVPVPTTPPRVEPAPTPPPPAFTAARSIAATHTTPEYPALSRRLREQGTLRLKLTIDEKGIVAQATVVNSSGAQRLDEAAVNWVKSHWRYTPAMQGTKAVPSTADAIVEFRLQ
jgi:periplasmic protein TonB